jgi:hypothetical protein
MFFWVNGVFCGYQSSSSSLRYLGAPESPFWPVRRNIMYELYSCAIKLSTWMWLFLSHIWQNQYLIWSVVDQLYFKQYKRVSFYRNSVLIFLNSLILDSHTEKIWPLDYFTFFKILSFFNVLTRVVKLHIVHYAACTKCSLFEKHIM